MTNVQPNSVDVSWDAQSRVDHYIVQYIQEQGSSQLGACIPASAHSVSVTTTNASKSFIIPSVGNDMLHEFTTYSITVTAVIEDSNFISIVPSTAILFTTAQKGTILCSYDNLCDCSYASRTLH